MNKRNLHPLTVIMLLGAAAAVAGVLLGGLLPGVHRLAVCLTVAGMVVFTVASAGDIVRVEQPEQEERRPRRETGRALQVRRHAA